MSLLPAYIMICVALVIAGYIFTRKFFNPVTFFTGIWLGIVLLYNLQLSKLQKPIDNQTFITLIVNVVSFTIAFLAVYVCMKVYNKIKKWKIQEKNIGDKFDKIPQTAETALPQKIQQNTTQNRPEEGLFENSFIQPVIRKIRVFRKIEITQTKESTKVTVNIKNKKQAIKNRKVIDIKRVHKKKENQKSEPKKATKVQTEKVANKKPVIIQDVKITKTKIESKKSKFNTFDVPESQTIIINEDIDKLQDNSSQWDAKQEIKSLVSINTIPKKKHKKIIEEPKRSIINFKLILCLFSIWLIIESIEVLASGGVPILWKIMGSSKTYFDFGIPSVHGLMNAIGLVIITFATYLYEETKKTEHKKNFRLLAVIGIMLGFYAIILTRQVIISAVLQIAIVKIFFIPRKSWKKVAIWGLICGLGGIMLFGVLGNLRTGYDNFLRVSSMQNSPAEPLAGFQWVYMYLTMTIANLNEFTMLNLNDLGVSTIISKRLPGILDNFSLFDGQKIPHHLVSNAYNASGFFADYYLGYGNTGVAIIAAFYGLLGGYYWYRLRTKRNEKYIIYYSIYMQFVLLSFFADFLVFLADGSQLIIAYFVFKFAESNFFQKRLDSKRDKNKNASLISENVSKPVSRLVRILPTRK